MANSNSKQQCVRSTIPITRAPSDYRNTRGQITPEIHTVCAHLKVIRWYPTEADILPYKGNSVCIIRGS